MSRVERLPKPGWCCNRPIYTVEQMVAYGEACARAALEAAADSCRREAADIRETAVPVSAVNALLGRAHAIRALSVGSGGSGS